jgi:predicted kinase
MATLHFIVGRAGAGKTTLARQLARDTPAVLICEDEWLSALNDSISTLTEYLVAARRWRSMIAPHVTVLLQLGVSVVFDFGGNTVTDRQWVRRIFEGAGADHLLHDIRASEETCRRRIDQRNDTRPRGLFFGVVTDAQVDEVNKYFVPPTANEGFRMIVCGE